MITIQIPQKVWETALNGGWQPTNSNAEAILDSQFWYCLGKALGWKEDDLTTRLYDDWFYRAREFYDLILTGGDLEAFWADLLTKEKL